MAIFKNGSFLKSISKPERITLMPLSAKLLTTTGKDLPKKCASSMAIISIFVFFSI